jgi:type II secretory ATPase GspE/PulE/Tfp pilus assembly ATPase PilB-like protein
MGLEPFLVTSTVTGVLAQRLVRALRAECRVPYDATAAELAALHLPPGQAPPRLMRAVGCEACQGIGYRGRTGVYELLVMTERLRPLVIDRARASELREQAAAEGMRSLREDGIAKVLAGVTTVEEMMRETQDHG